MVLICKYCGKKGGVEGRTLHKFPLKDPDILQAWLAEINLGSFTPTNSSRLCSNHFESKCFDKKDTRLMLRPGSIPTLFGEYKSVCAFCNASKGEDNQLSFRKFPIKNPDLLETWIKALNLKNYVPTKHSVLCSNHFQQNCFYAVGNTGYLRLKATAVPSILTKFGAVDSNIQFNHLSPEVPSHPPKCRRLSESQNPVSVVQENTSVTEQGISLDPISDILTTPKLKNPPEQPNTGSRRKLFQHDHSYETTVESMKLKLISAQRKMKMLQSQNKVQKQHIGRLRRKIRSLKDIVRELRKNRSIPESGLACLDAIADADVSQLVERFIRNKRSAGNQPQTVKKRPWKSQRKNTGLGISNHKYPPALRSFAMTLHFYSPKAYGFVRRKFCQALPDPSTLRSWYASISGEPGFTSESFDALKLKVDEAQKLGKEVMCSLMLDEISIKKGLRNVSAGKVRGYVDIGNGAATSDTLPLAKDSLVLMVVSLDGSWKVPIGYFLINGIDSATNAGLLVEGLIRLHNIGVKVVSVTLDGPPQHFATMRVLGANFSMEDTRPFFPHPITREKIHVIFDACHMLKLVRNCLGEYQVLKDGDGNTIDWRFIIELANMQEREGLRAGNKLKMAHVHYHKMKMKVYLAAQTLSSSVADAIEFCAQKLQLKNFQGSEATVRFIRCIDQVFDFLNSRNPFGKGFKAPLRRSNETFWRSRIFTHIDYLKKMTDLENNLLTKSRRYVPFVGLISSVLSIVEIFDNYVKPENSQLKYLLTYKCSQDHLELFFCAIRSCGGWCPNPTSAQFISAYKRLLIHHEVKAVNGNATALDSTKILSIPSTRPLKMDCYDPGVYDSMVNIRIAKKYGLDNDDDVCQQDDEFFSEFLNFKNRLPETLSGFSRSCAANIGGWVVKKLVDERKPIVKCELCRVALFQQSQIRAEFEDNGLVEAKTRGGLIFPSKSVVDICLYTERLLRHALNKIHCMVPCENNFPAILCSKVMTDLLQTPCTLFSTLNEHLYDDAVEDSNHIYLLTKHVCINYIKVRLFAATKLASEAAIGDKVRHHLTRQIIWRNQ